MKRWKMKGQPASHGHSKTHRKMGATGGGQVWNTDKSCNLGHWIYRQFWDKNMASLSQLGQLSVKMIKEWSKQIWPVLGKETCSCFFCFLYYRRAWHLVVSSQVMPWWHWSLFFYKIRLWPFVGSGNHSARSSELFFFHNSFFFFFWF